MKDEGDQLIRIDGDLMLNGGAGFEPYLDITSAVWLTRP